MKTAAKIRQVYELYKGNAFSFIKEAITLPNGRDTEMAMIRHPGSTAIVPLLDDNTVVMTLQYRHAIRDYILEIPAGTLDPGETPMECAQRELEEETGYRAGKMTALSQIHILPAYTDEKIHLYLADDLTLSEQHLDADEIIQVKKYPLSELIRMIENGTITDGLTIISIWTAARHVNALSLTV